jgi:hypothetical protein
LLLSLPVLAGRLFYRTVYCAAPVNLSLHKQPQSITFDDIPSELKDIIVGLALGDFHIRRRNKFDVNCSVHNRKDRGNKSHLIYIKADSWEKFKSLIEPHVIPHFAYKLVRRGSPTSW